jgi:AcrR family transcriptional regulator
MATNSNTLRNTAWLRVLESASAIFAKKGYRAATIAEICEHASANLASVNYCFGEKSQLYDQVLLCAMSVISQFLLLNMNSSGLTRYF